MPKSLKYITEFLINKNLKINRNIFFFFLSMKLAYYFVVKNAYKLYYLWVRNIYFKSKNFYKFCNYYK